MLAVDKDEQVMEEDIHRRHTVLARFPAWQEGHHHTEPVCHKTVIAELDHLIGPQCVYGALSPIE